MAESKGSGVTDNLPRWQVALAIGTPVALGIAGIWYYKTRKSKATLSDFDKDVKLKVDQEIPPQEVVQDPIQRAQSAKNKGNKNFKVGRYDKAIACYTEAIDICPKENKDDIATFYQNRAAAYEQLKNYESVINDCTKALEYNSRYTKALFRRAKAAEVKNDLTQCLEDVTAVCILENFANQQSLLMADRVLKDLGRSRAKDKYQSRSPQDPSSQFVHNYFSAFANDPILNGVYSAEKHEAGTPDRTDEIYQDEEMEKSESPYKNALRNVRKKKKCSDVVRLCSEEIALETTTHHAEALLLRATFYLLRGEQNAAMDDFERLLNMNEVDKRIRSNALIKRGSLMMQRGQQDEALEDFNAAEKQDPDNSDIYHHRGQLLLLLEKVEEAVTDFERSVALSPSFAIAHVQKCYTDFRLALHQQDMSKSQEAMKAFESTIDSFPKCAEGYALYGQALIDLGLYDKADENFKRALELEPDNGNIYVHRGLLRLQWKQDIDEAARLINQAMEVDDKCEFAYETLGTIEIQRGSLDKAINLFNTAINLSKTEAEMAHLYSLLDAAMAQSRVARYLGIQLPSMM